MTSEEFYKTLEKMKKKTYTDLSELNRDLQSTSRGIDSIIPVTSNSDIKRTQERKQPCQSCILLESNEKKYVMFVSCKRTAGWYGH